jgi:exodeoxyribonuclease V gamma subunit
MPLVIEYVSSLEEVIEPALGQLTRPLADLFTRQRIVVPTAGAKAWLADELAHRLGRRGPGDGIIANVDFSYPGTISQLLDAATARHDPWAVEPLVFTVLEVIAGNPAYDPIRRRAGGPLLAARRIADRFDRYHFRRPGMILEWEAGRACLSPTADDATASGVRRARPLAREDRWQFELWRELRDRIGQPSPPARERQAEGPAPEAVLVAGLESMSLRQLALLERLASLPGPSGAACEVRVVLVHPSPPLAQRWAAAAPPQSPGVPPLRGEPAAHGEVDPLVAAWLRGTRENQWLLASQGHEPVHAAPPSKSGSREPGSLLARLQHTISSDCVATRAPFDPADESLRIHRCHDLGRQAEVIHDALLHAFADLEDLAPHEVVIVSPRIADLAPHLEAVFARTLEQQHGPAGRVRLPLQVADRGIREVSRGAELLAAIVELVGSRCSVEGLMAVASHPLVMAHHDLDDDVLDRWRWCIEQTRIRWGLDAARRARFGLNEPDLSAHTWQHGLERALLGGMLPDGPPRPVLGGVVPLRQVETAEIEAIASLIAIVTVIDELDASLSEDRPAAVWCELLEAAVVRLAGDSTDDLEPALRALDPLRRTACHVPVPYRDVQTILSAALTAPVGRQPLRTGGITATSMIPLRGVPFRVVCVAGFDDDAVAPRDGESDDLVDRQQLCGDLDPRLEIRRSLLDCLLAAQQRLIITCTGRSVVNNATTPLATPLAELVDFVGRHGVPVSERKDGEASEIEVFHPRHACSRDNFRVGALRATGVWSHDPAAAATAASLGSEPPPCPASRPAPSPQTQIEIPSLGAFLHDPLWPFVRETLEINPWRDDAAIIPAVVPLELARLERRNLRDGYLEQVITAADPGPLAEDWGEAVAANGEVPIGGFGERVVREVTSFAAELVAQTEDDHLPLADGVAESLRVDLDGFSISGTLERFYPEAATAVLLRPDAGASDRFRRPRLLAVVQLLAAAAAGLPLERVVVFSQHEKWSPGALDGRGRPQSAVQTRSVTLDPDIDRNAAVRLLEGICDLYRQASAAPFGSFGKAGVTLAEDLDEARQEFRKFNLGRGFTTSLEALVWGLRPRFEEVYGAPDAAVVEFFARLDLLAKIDRRHVYRGRVS